MRLWRLSPDEVRPVALTLGQSFLIGLSRVFTASAASALFLSRFPAADLPYAYLLGGLVLSVVGVVYVRSERRAGAAAGVGAFLLLAAVLFACRLGLHAPQTAGAIAFALVLLSEVEFTLTNVTFWSLANRVFRAREAGRAFGLISAGEVLPSILGGLLIPALVHRVGVENLLYLSASGHLVSAAWLAGTRRLLADRYVTRDESDEPSRERPSLRALFKRRYLLLIAASVWLNLLVFYFVDNAFYGAAQAQFGDPVQLASFVGTFFVALGICSLLFKTLLSGRWRTWFGMRVALLTTPASLAVACLLVLLTPIFSEDAGRVFAVIVVLKLIERVFIEGVFNPTYYALFQPLPISLRTPAQNAIESTVAQVATAIAAGVLIGLEHRAGGVVVADLVTATLVVVVLWLVLGFVLGREYNHVLRESLGQKLSASREVPAKLDGPDSLLAQALKSERLGKLLSTLQMLRGADLAPVAPMLLKLLDHPHRAVVVRAQELLLAHDKQRLGEALLERISRPQASPERLAAWLSAIGAAAPENWQAQVAERLHSEHPRVRAAAAGALLHGSDEVRRRVLPVLEEMTHSPDASQREAAAAALGEAGAAEAGALLALLNDPELAVRREALRSAARSLEGPPLWSRVIPALAEPGLRALAVEVLSRAGPSVLPHLARALPSAPRAMQEAMLDVAARIDLEAALPLFRDVFLGRDRELALLGVEALGRNRRMAAPSLVPPLKALLAERYERHRALLHARVGWLEQAGAEMLCGALADELAEVEVSLLAILGVLYDSGLRTVRQRLQMGGADELSLSLEYLESALPPEEVVRATAVFDPLERAQTERRAREKVEPDWRARLAPLLRAQGPWVTPWIQACAAEVAYRRGFAEGAPATAYLVERVRVLSALPLFKGTRGARLSALAAGCAERSLKPGEELLGLGVPSGSLFVVLDGALDAQDEDPVLSGGGINLLNALAPARSPIRVSALERSRVLEVRHQQLDPMLEEDFEFAWRVLVNLCEMSRTGGVAVAEEPPPRGTIPPVPSSVPEKVLALGSVGAFRGLDEGILTALAANVDERVFAPGEDMVVFGEKGARLFVLFEGAARVHRSGGTLAELSAPSVFGELSILSPAPRDASITAVEPSRVLVLGRAVFYELMREEPLVVRSMQQVLLKRALGASRLNVTMDDHVGFVAALLG